MNQETFCIINWNLADFESCQLYKNGECSACDAANKQKQLDSRVNEFDRTLHWLKDGDPSIVEYKRKEGRAIIVLEKGFNFYDSFLKYVTESFGWEAWEKMWVKREASNGTRSDTDR